MMLPIKLTTKWDVACGMDVVIIIIYIMNEEVWDFLWCRVVKHGKFIIVANSKRGNLREKGF